MNMKWDLDVMYKGYDDPKYINDIKKVEEKDILLIKPGEKIPLDGIILEGESHLDTSSLTGESKPKHVSVNDKVLSGCINQENILKIKATSTYKTSTAAKIIDIIEKSPSKKSKSENSYSLYFSLDNPFPNFFLTLPYDE